MFSLVLALSVMAAGSGPAGTVDGDVVVEIQVSPSTILLDWKAKGDVKVTVHADVSFSFFDPRNIEVSLDGIGATYIKSDARGDLVAKFDFHQIADGLEAGSASGSATLRLRAVSRDGTVYTGEDDVRVVGF
jgi:hypothetical protein